MCFILPIGISTQNITGTLSTMVIDCISKETLHTSLTVEAFCIKQTFETLSCVRITVSCVQTVPIRRTVTWLTTSSWQLWITMEVISTNITPSTDYLFHISPWIYQISFYLSPAYPSSHWHMGCMVISSK